MLLPGWIAIWNLDVAIAPFNVGRRAKEIKHQAQGSAPASKDSRKVMVRLVRSRQRSGDFLLLSNAGGAVLPSVDPDGTTIFGRGSGS